jgi:hypothetical protein
MFAKLFEDRLENGLKTRHFLGVRLASHEVFWPVAEPSKRASFRPREHFKQLARGGLRVDETSRK